MNWCKGEKLIPELKNIYNHLEFTLPESPTFFRQQHLISNKQELMSELKKTQDIQNLGEKISDIQFYLSMIPSTTIISLLQKPAFLRRYLPKERINEARTLINLGVKINNLLPESYLHIDKIKYLQEKLNSTEDMEDLSVAIYVDDGEILEFYKFLVKADIRIAKSLLEGGLYKYLPIITEDKFYVDYIENSLIGEPRTYPKEKVKKLILRQALVQFGFLDSENPRINLSGDPTPNYSIYLVTKIAPTTLFRDSSDNKNFTVYISDKMIRCFEEV